MSMSAIKGIILVSVKHELPFTDPYDPSTVEVEMIAGHFAF